LVAQRGLGKNAVVRFGGIRKQRRKGKDAHGGVTPADARALRMSSSNSLIAMFAMQQQNIILKI
jgi:hypothetical protein